MKLLFILNICAALSAVGEERGLCNVRPTDSVAYHAIRNTLSAVDRIYVALDKDGMIDKHLINSHRSSGGNFNALKTLVNDPRTIEVIQANEYRYRHKDGSIRSGKLGVLYFNELEDAGRYTKGYTKEQLQAMGFEDKSKRNGAYGITLVPGGEKDTAGDGIGSPNGNIVVVLSVDLTERDAARAFAHEANGHVLYFVMGKDFNHSEKKMSDGNIELEDQINRSVIEAEKNYDDSHKKRY
jgi:hypothetical protein